MKNNNLTFRTGAAMKLKIKDSFSAYNGLPKEIYLLFTARIITSIGSFVLPLLTLILSQKLGMSETETGNFAALLILSQGPCLLLGGKLIDAIGQKKMLVFCQTLGALFYFMCGFIKDHTTLLVFIMIAADLFVAASPAYQTMVARLTVPDNRKASYSLLYLGINIGMAVSPLIGGLLFEKHLPLLFILDAVTSLLSTGLIALYIRLPKENPREDSDPAAPAQTGRHVFSVVVLKNTPVLLFFLLFLFVFDFTYIQWSFMLPLQFHELYGSNGARFYSFISIVYSAADEADREIPSACGCDRRGNLLLCVLCPVCLCKEYSRLFDCRHAVHLWRNIDRDQSRGVYRGTFPRRLPWPDERGPPVPAGNRQRAGSAGDGKGPALFRLPILLAACGGGCAGRLRGNVFS